MSRFAESVGPTSFLIFFHLFNLAGQAIGLQDELTYPGADVVWPKLVHREEPMYPNNALQLGVQGDILIATTIDKNGIPRDPLILSTLGHGLDERALDCLSKWRFTPATRNGLDVNFRATFQISFRILGRSFDDRAEKRRVGAAAIDTLLSRQENGKPSEDSRQLTRSLADYGWEQAEYQMALWQIEGDVMPKDDGTGLQRMLKAADKGFPPAMVFIGDALLDGRGMPQNMKRGQALLRKAAAKGSIAADLDLGKRYMDGRGLKPDAHEAQKYLQVCSQAGRAECAALADQLRK